MDFDKTWNGLIAGWINNTPIGMIGLALSKNGLLALEVGLPQEEFFSRMKLKYKTDIIQDDNQTRDISKQITAYLDGELKQFNIEIDWMGIPEFQKMVLLTTLSIPYGETITYGEIAKRIGKPNAARAVGRAEATNPIPIIIPCHRVIGIDGSLRGYGVPGGVRVKEKLLRMERGEKYLF